MVSNKIILEGIEIVDLCLYLIEQNTLILGDLHIGYEDTLKSKGFLVPKQQLKLTKTRILKIIEFIKKKYSINLIEKIIINGDLKHEFGIIQKSEWKETLELIDLLTIKCQEVIVIKGNHDKIIQPILSKRNIKVKEYFLIQKAHKDPKSKDNNKILLCHGDQVPEEAENAQTIIIGHEHPAIKLKQYPRTEVYKIFVKTRWNNKILIVMPSFNLLSKGSNILEMKFLSPFLNTNHSNKKEIIELFVVSDKKIFNFPDLNFISID
ncbi:metallophosphoesterase [archaeon]|jgi:uncharacterized protein|nr:metallophosphoesterase [archaeon]MBT3451021.1 metallophosphoesterase [archaeon]MBT6868559.1 metallophosphoesterase [archaeon]MBT7193091.1 metallophosphoesterase [archaeon]MBT7380408.1 metallophosphoesterase [archaeon]